MINTIWLYLNSPHSSDFLNKLQGIPVFMKYPKKGVAYTQGNMKWGILVQIILSLYMTTLLILKLSEFSLFSLVVSAWLLASNFCSLLIKLIFSSLISSLDCNLPAEQLRIQMKSIFEKRIYYFNVIFTGLCLINYIICCPLSFLFWKFGDSQPDLFFYSVIFLLKYFYSVHRYSKYFMRTQNDDNPLELAEIYISGTDSAQSNVINSDCCSICLQEFHSKQKILCFPCSHKHQFHATCLNQWLSNKYSCPLCKFQLLPDTENFS